MKDKDLEEFEKWWMEFVKKDLGLNVKAIPDHKIYKAWQAACEYKDKEFMNEVRQTPSGVSVVKFNKELVRKEIEKLQAENKKLREALEWYADRKNCDNPDFAHVEIDEHGEEIADGGYKAREVLKEVGEE